MERRGDGGQSCLEEVWRRSHRGRARRDSSREGV